MSHPMSAELTRSLENSKHLRNDAHLEAMPVVPRAGVLQPLSIDQITVDGGFWGTRQRLNADTMIPHCASWIDRVGAVNNFLAAAQSRLPSDRMGREFADSDVYKLLEAVSWELAREESVALRREYVALVAIVSAAQEADGYINTNFGRPGQQPRYSDLEDGHELYCVGHLIQAGVASARSGLGDELLDIAVKAADHVCREFGPGARNGVCGHPEIETALMELGRLKNEQKYCDQARLFLERRGNGTLVPSDFGPQYFQDNCGVRDRDAFEGHAVRALSLAAGKHDSRSVANGEVIYCP